MNTATATIVGFTILILFTLFLTLASERYHARRRARFLATHRRCDYCGGAGWVRTASGDHR